MKVLFIIGASGSGKSYLEKQMIDMYPDKFHKIKSFTTRSKRVQETSDEYHFITKDDYLKLKEEDKIVQETHFDNNIYGSLLEDYSKDKINIIVCVPKSMKQVEDYFNLTENDKYVIYLKKDKQTMITNMLSRGQNLEEINQRLANDDIDDQIDIYNVTPNILLNNNDQNNICKIIELIF